VPQDRFCLSERHSVIQEKFTLEACCCLGAESAPRAYGLGDQQEERHFLFGVENATHLFSPPRAVPQGARVAAVD
jgi:hypothetical protein